MKLDGDQGRYRSALDSLRLPPFAVRDGSRPFIVALEGANGAGKSTLCRLLSGLLAVPACLGTDEAWFSDSFKMRMIRDAEWFASAMFFLSGCFEQMRVLGDRPDALVIMDRSLCPTCGSRRRKPGAPRSGCRHAAAFCRPDSRPRSHTRARREFRDLPVAHSLKNRSGPSPG